MLIKSIKPRTSSKARVFITKGRLERKRQGQKPGLSDTQKRLSMTEIPNSSYGRDLVVQRDVLDKEECDFWGIDSTDNLYKKLISHVALSTLKSKELHCKTISNISTIEGFRNLFRQAKTRNMLEKYRTLRLTFRGGDFAFNFDGKECNHTIGLVLDEKHRTLYVLDSLGDDEYDLKRFHKLIVEVLENKSETSKYDKIIYNKEKQQGDFDLTCSNWTWANIEAVQNGIRHGGYIANSKTLDKILPKNINQVLKEQHQYILEHIDKLAEKFKDLI